MSTFLFLHIFLLFFITPGYAEDTIYNWTDDNNVRHYTNRKQNIDKSRSEKVNELEFGESSRFRNTHPDPDYYESEEFKEETRENEKEQEKIKKIWQSRMKTLDMKITAIEQEIQFIQKRMGYLDIEIDYLLINGYSADYLIYQLRTLENRIKPLENRIDLLEEEKEKLKYQARKEGIPPGYLRY